MYVTMSLSLYNVYNSLLYFILHSPFSFLATLLVSIKYRQNNRKVITQHKTFSYVINLCLFTLWSKDLPETLRDFHIARKFLAFYGPHISSTTFNTAQVHSTSQKCVLILSSHLRLDLASCLLSSGFPTINVHALILSPYLLHILIIWVFLTWSLKWYLMSTKRKHIDI
jgi:hypothetical protein